ncbi:cation transporter, partial [Micrococcus luteus]|nr:cation transporter [Micrococcus luteus]
FFSSIMVMILTVPLGTAYTDHLTRPLDLEAVRIRLSELPHVLEVHDLHASRIDSDTPVLSAHVTVHNGCLTAAHLGTVLTDLQRCVAQDFQVPIEHSTFQIEPATHPHTETLHP